MMRNLARDYCAIKIFGFKFRAFAVLDKIFYLQIKLRVKFNCHDKSTTSIL